ncbi:hypothetical protein D9615_004575 [Tricholomella constricta]|uniref:Uncharacterized protein n=1 Tax=Tricholomella constricta TaxID=117010 RepID=A0A8H5M4E9_9AGAR|nr:hypothetical protein D9615_004575 [Tricholomella constricta]
MAPQALTSIRTSNGKLEIVNQLLLPHTTEFLEINSIQEAHDAIKTMKAPSLASLALSYHLSEGLAASPTPDFLASPEALKAHVEPILSFLFTARPTAVNLGAATRRLQNTLTASFTAESDVRVIAKAIIAEGKQIADEDVGRNKEMSKWGGDWLLKRVSPEKSLSGLNVMTVCNTGSLATSGYGTALGLITYLHEAGKLDKAYYTQTTPYHQGSRLTALELQTLNIPSVMLCDTMIGTYNAAVLAARHSIPFIVVAPISTVDLDVVDGSGIPIEQRPPLEACLVRGALYPGTGNPTDEQAVVMITPRGLEGIYNPSFDVTPAELITAIVTEKGVAVRKNGEKTFDLSGIMYALFRSFKIHCPDDDETIRHYLYQCSHYRYARADLVAKLGRDAHAADTLYGTRKGVKSLLQYVADTDRLKDTFGDVTPYNLTDDDEDDYLQPDLDPFDEEDDDGEDD